MLHTIQANDVIPILPPAVGWVAAATLVYSHVPQGASVATGYWAHISNQELDLCLTVFWSSIASSDCFSHRVFAATQLLAIA